MTDKVDLRQTRLILTDKVYTERQGLQCQTRFTLTDKVDTDRQG